LKFGKLSPNVGSLLNITNRILEKDVLSVCVLQVGR
jgi:hypothetical protein